MATIEPCGKGYRVRESVGGRYKTIATTGTKEEALAIKRRLDLTKRARSLVVRGVSVPLTELIERWKLAKIAGGNDPLHTAGAAARLRTLCQARNWASTAAITPSVIQDYRNNGGSPRTCGFLAALLAWSVTTLDQYVDPRTLVALRPGKARRMPRGDLMAPEQVAALVARAERMSESAGTLVHCLATYGWRPITAARLTVADFDAVAGTITTAVKGGDTVRHPLLPETVARLRALVGLRAPDAPLFVHPRTGEAWALRDGFSIPQWARDHLAIKVYDLKRYAISSMLDRGLEPHVVALFTGHRTIGQVWGYARTNERRARSALERMAPGDAAAPGRFVGAEPEMAEDRQSKILQFPGITCKN